MRDSKKPRRRVILLSLAAIALLAAAVCALHAVNALTLRGTARVSDYALLERTGETFSFSGSELPLLAGGGLRLAPQVETIELQGGVLRVAGLLLRPGQTVDEVRVRVGLILAGEAEAGLTGSESILLLNTQMVRREEAGAQGLDDHCGFCATAARRLLEDGQYAVVLVDESDGARRLVDTRMRIALSGDGLAVERMGDTKDMKGTKEEAGA